MPMVLDHVNVYALDDGAAGWTLIDTGLNTPATREAWQALLAGPLQGRPVHRVICTHHHTDHIGLAGWFQSQGASLWISRTAWLTARMLQLDVHERPSAEMIRFYQRAGMHEAILQERLHQRPFNFADTTAPLPLGFQRLSDGQTLKVGGKSWKVRFGSGHAPDHASLWGEDIIIGGDQLLPSISANISVHASEPDADPLQDWLESCRRFQPLAREHHLVLPGHKLPYRGLPRRLSQMIEGHVTALDRLEAHLNQPRLASECFSPLFKRAITPAIYGLALGETLAHLNHLWHQGRIRRQLNDQGAWVWQRAQVKSAATNKAL